MSHRIEAPYLAPRRYVPKELTHARIGVMDDGPLALAHAIKLRFRKCRYRHCTVLVDINGVVYACMRPGASLEYVCTMYPQLVAGRYTPEVDAADIAADLEFMGEAA